MALFQYCRDCEAELGPEGDAIAGYCAQCKDETADATPHERPYLVVYAEQAFGPVTATGPEDALRQVNESRPNQFTDHATFTVYPIRVDAAGEPTTVELAWSDVD